MGWQNELTIITRTLINDFNEPYTYSDDRIQQILTISAKYVQFDVNIEQKYSVDVTNINISPDPTSINDEIFISLVCLKAACLVDQATFRTKAALEGIKASLGPASLAVGGNLSGWKTLLELGPCATYDELTSHWDVKDATAVKSILSPFVGNKFDPRYLNNIHRQRDFYF